MYYGDLLSKNNITKLLTKVFFVLHCGMNKFSFKIENDEYTWDFETKSFPNFLWELEDALKEIGELDKEDTLEISSLSSEEKKILHLAGY